MAPSTYKIFYLKKQVIFPYCSLVVFVRPSEESKAIQKGDRVLAYTMRSSIDVIWYRGKTATLSEVTDVQEDGKAVKIFLKGLSRVSLTRIIRYKNAEFEPLAEGTGGMSEAMRNGLRKKSQELVFLINVEESDRLIKLLNYIVDPAQMTDFISNYFIMDFRTKYRLYGQPDILKRGEMLLAALDRMIGRMTKKRKKSGS
jgi:ATP-dependent Lon protease